MNIKQLLYKEKDNINKLVKCCKKDKEILRNIPHQPGEFSSKPFKLTTKCELNKKGDYYDYYKGSKQLATFENNMKTPFTAIKIINIKNKVIRVIEPKLSIWPHYKILDSNNNFKYKINNAFSFILPGTGLWGPFLNHVFPYIYFSKDILDNDHNIEILIKKPKFDSFKFLIRNILKLKNKITFVKSNEQILVNSLYILQVSGPFASGLFPYQAYCNVPIVLYKNINKYIRKNLEDIKDRKLLIYTRRNNTDVKKRLIRNENIIINYLKNYCIKNNLTFINYTYKDYSPEQRVNLFNKAKIVIGPHGSANHHVYFCNKNTHVIEFIFIKDCHNDATFSLAFDLDYWQIPVKEFGQYEKNIKISNDALNSMYEILSYIR